VSSPRSYVGKEGRFKIRSITKRMKTVKIYTIFHINHKASMDVRKCLWVFDIDKEVELYSNADPLKEDRSMALYGALYSIKMIDGHTLFVEVNQYNPMMNVELVM
jgi:hypothetical protein